MSEYGKYLTTPALASDFCGLCVFESKTLSLALGVDVANGSGMTGSAVDVVLRILFRGGVECKRSDSYAESVMFIIAALSDNEWEGCGDWVWKVGKNSKIQFLTSKSFGISVADTSLAASNSQPV